MSGDVTSWSAPRRQSAAPAVAGNPRGARVISGSPPQEATTPFSGSPSAGSALRLQLSNASNATFSTTNTTSSTPTGFSSVFATAAPTTTSARGSLNGSLISPTRDVISQNSSPPLAMPPPPLAPPPAPPAEAAAERDDPPISPPRLYTVPLPPQDAEVKAWQTFAIKFDPSSALHGAGSPPSAPSALHARPSAAVTTATEYLPIPPLPPGDDPPTPLSTSQSPPQRESPRISVGSPARSLSSEGASLAASGISASSPPSSLTSSGLSRSQRHKSPARPDRITHPKEKLSSGAPSEPERTGTQRPIVKSRSANSIATSVSDTIGSAPTAPASAVANVPGVASGNRPASGSGSGSGLTAFQALAALATVQPPAPTPAPAPVNQSKSSKTLSKRDTSLSPPNERKGSPRSSVTVVSSAPTSAGSSQVADVPDAVLLDYGSALQLGQRTLDRGGSAPLFVLLDDKRISSLWRVWLHAELGTSPPLESIERWMPKSPADELLMRHNPIGSTLLDLALARDQAVWLAPIAALLGPQRIKSYRTASDESLFYAACAGGRAKCVRWMIASKLATVEDADADGPYKGESSVFQAIAEDHVSVVQLLLPLRPTSLLRRNGEGLSAVDMLYARGSDAMFHEIHRYQWWCRARLLLYAHLRMTDNPIARLPANAFYRILSLIRVRGRNFNLPL